MSIGLVNEKVRPETQKFKEKVAEGMTKVGIEDSSVSGEVGGNIRPNIIPSTVLLSPCPLQTKSHLIFETQLCLETVVTTKIPGWQV